MAILKRFRRHFDRKLVLLIPEDGKLARLAACSVFQRPGRRPIERWLRPKADSGHFPASKDGQITVVLVGENLPPWTNIVKLK